jgi:glycosyltransferase involved in cell wall biosynthesis
LAKVKDKTKLTLIVAGEFYEDKTQYTKLIDKLGLKDHVKVFAGFVDKHKVKYYFSAADIVAQPYLSATQSGVTQIAYHFETPMLVTNVGGLPEMVPHKKVGYVCERKPESLSLAIESFFKDDDNSKFRENIVEEKKRFQWDFFADQLVQLAQEIK